MALQVLETSARRLSWASVADSGGAVASRLRTWHDLGPGAVHECRSLIWARDSGQEEAAAFAGSGCGNAADGAAEHAVTFVGRKP